jgi:hypothetical protein
MARKDLPEDGRDRREGTTALGELELGEPREAAE